MEQKQFHRKQNFAPDGNTRFLIIPREYMGAAILNAAVALSH
jgi:hypothetical protein